MNFEQEVYDKVISGEGILRYDYQEFVSLFYKLDNFFYITKYNTENEIDEVYGELTNIDDQIINPKYCPIAFIKQNYVDENYIQKNYEKLLELEEGESYTIRNGDIYLFMKDGGISAFFDNYGYNLHEIRLKEFDSENYPFTSNCECLLIYDLERKNPSYKIFREFIEEDS